MLLVAPSSCDKSQIKAKRASQTKWWQIVPLAFNADRRLPLIVTAVVRTMRCRLDTSTPCSSSASSVPPNEPNELR